MPNHSPIRMLQVGKRDDGAQDYDEENDHDLEETEGDGVRYMIAQESIPFEEYFAVALRNGLTKPKRVRGSGTKMVNMGELFAHDRIRAIEMDRVPMTERERQVALLEEHDLLFARQSLVREGAGKCSIFFGDSEDVTFESHLIRARLDRTKAEPLFFYYYFRSPEGRLIVDTIIEQVAAAGIRGSDLAKLPVPSLPLDEQHRIAHILGTLDDKIELNRRMNRTLEAIAGAIFKSWFIDFDPVIDNAILNAKPIPDEFAKRAEIRRARLAHESVGATGRSPLPENNRRLFPDEFQDSELGPIPKGWEIASFADTVEVLSGGTPKTSVPEYWGAEIPWFSVTDVPREADVFVIDTKKKVTQAGVENSSTRVLPKGTTIITARGTVGKVALIGVPMAMNQSCYGLRGVRDTYGYYTYYFCPPDCRASAADGAWVGF